MTEYFATGGDLYQWDIGRKVTLALPEGETASVVEYTVNNEANALVVDVNGNEAAIPNILLQTAGGLRMWAVTVTADGRQTRRYGSAPVYSRAKPDDYIYTETEVKRYEDFEERIKALEENGGGAVESVNGQTGAVKLTAADVGAIPVDKPGTIKSTGVLIAGDGQPHYARMEGGDGRAMFSMRDKDGNILNRVSLRETETTLGQPLAINSGGHGGKTAAEGRENLSLYSKDEIAEILLKYLPTTGGAATGPIIAPRYESTHTDANGRLVDIYYYPTSYGNLYMALQHDGVVVNAMTLTPDYTRFNIPVEVNSGGTGEKTIQGMRNKFELYSKGEIDAKIEGIEDDVERLTEENIEIKQQIDAISNLEATTGDATVKVTGWTSGRIDSGEHRDNAAIAYSEIMPCIGQAFHFDSTVYKMMYIRYNADGTRGTVGTWVTESPLVVSAHSQPNVRVQVYTIDASRITDAMFADLPNQVTYTVPEQGEVTTKVPIVQAVLDLSAANVPPRYVDGVTGSDNNPGTADAPFATIQKGVDSGTKLLYVEPGEYAEYVRITNRDELTIMPTAYPETYDITAPETPMIHITGTEESRIGRALYITNCGKITIIGVWGDYTTYETIHAINVKDLTMIGCYASNGASEMSAFKTNNTNAVFRRCKAWNAGKDGFGLSGHGDVSLYDCIAHDCADDGVSHHNSNTGIIVGGEFYNCGKGGVSSPTYGAYIDIIGVYSHDNVYGLYAMNDMDRRESVGKICGCVFINNTTADLRIGQNCRVTGWNNVYQTKSVMDAATYVEIGAVSSEA